MSDTEHEDRIVGHTPPLLVFDDATSDTEVEPPSPGGSLKGLYVRSRPTSMDGSLFEFPGGAADLDFTHFGLTSTHPPVLFIDDATSETEVEPVSPGGSLQGLYVRSRPTSLDGSLLEFPGFAPTPTDPHAIPPDPLHFPPPPIIDAPPFCKRRRYAASMKSLYTGTGTGTVLKTNRAPIIPVKTVPRVLEDQPVTPLPAKASSRSWNTLRKMVPGLFRRPATHVANEAQNTAVDFTSVPSQSFSTTPASSMRTRALSIRSFKSSKAKGKGRAAEIENIPPLPTRAAPTSPRRVHSFSGYLADSELPDDEDETDAEMTPVDLEALATVLKINERYEFALAGPQEIGVAL
ncbi:hypothetical protein B0H12DRAFT_1329207 [Mycena haematopus]|nr:hypothetical protein B0H12DRAFT_1329207 [Mycena haematopus]